jgi:hypothetical protein
MGHYRKKPYKKKSLDIEHTKKLLDDYITHIDGDEEEDFFSEDELLVDETRILEEPEIVTTLRKEELEGKLPVLLYESLYGESESSKKQNIKEMQLQESFTNASLRKKDIEETLVLAKKSLEKVTKNNSIIFEDDIK